MTEKRYSLVYYADKGGAFIKNNETGTEWYHDSRASLLEIVNKLNELNDENEQLKKENYELHKRLGDFEPFERYMKEITSKTSLEDIIGIVKTDEPTNSVELKKELYK